MRNDSLKTILIVFISEIVLGQSFTNLEQAFREPQKVITLTINDDSKIKHLPAKFGSLINLEELEISCLENLEDLPKEIGNLTKLKKIIIDNGNGCQMNIFIPESIGNLINLKVLRLYGALDPRGIGSDKFDSTSHIKTLPGTIEKLENLEELDLGRNGITTIPSQIASLKKLKRLSLDYNNIHELPEFIGTLKNLKELSICSNGGVKLPKSLSNLNRVKVFMGNNYLNLKDQKKLRNLFPNVIFSFENEYDDDAANEETPR